MVLNSAHCPSKEGSDGCCRHVAAVLFDLQVTVSNNLMTTCTSGKYEWKRRRGNSEYATPLKDLKIVEAEFGKSDKNPIKPHDFDPGPSSFDPVLMRKKLREGLQVLHPASVEMQFLLNLRIQQFQNK